MWFPSHSKYDWKENGSPVCLEDDYAPYPSTYLKDKLSACDCLRTGNIPFDVIPSRKLGAIPNNLLIASNVVNIRDEEMREIESFVLGAAASTCPDTSSIRGCWSCLKWSTWADGARRHLHETQRRRARPGFRASRTDRRWRCRGLRS